MELGPVEKKIVDQCVRYKKPLPARIANAPFLRMGLDLYYLAFLDLTSCRTQGYAEGPISWLSIAHYAQLNGYNDDQIEDLFVHIGEMDTVYLKFRADKISASTKVSPT